MNSPVRVTNAGEGGHQRFGHRWGGERDESANLVSDGLMTVAEAVAFLRLSRTTLYGLMDTGRLAYVRVGRARRIPRRALVELAATNLVGPPPDS
jgi:excisionase family DNA binding protein